MGVTLEFLNDNHGVKATVRDELTGEEFVEGVRQVNAFAATAGPICYTFVDFNHLKRILVSVGDLAKASLCAVEASKLTETERVVAAYAGDEYTYRLAVIYMLFIEETGWEAWTFRDRSEAVGWLRSRAALKHGLTIDEI